MAKDRAINPAAAQRKADKQKALKKGKAVVAAQRNERLAHRNPERLQRQIDEIKALSDSSGQLTVQHKRTVEDLERELARVRKAKDAVGDKYAERKPAQRDSKPNERRSNANHTILGKRERPWHAEQTSMSSDTDEGVDDIPMPRDTPPPLPRAKRNVGNFGGGARMQSAPDAEKASHIELAPERKPPQAQIPSRTVYESKAIIRDLRKEAVGFVPSAVKRRADPGQGNTKAHSLQEDELQARESQGQEKRGSAAADSESAKSELGNMDPERASTHLARKPNQVQMEEDLEDTS